MFLRVITALLIFLRVITVTSLTSYIIKPFFLTHSNTIVMYFNRKFNWRLNTTLSGSEW